MADPVDATTASDEVKAYKIHVSPLQHDAEQQH